MAISSSFLISDFCALPKGIDYRDDLNLLFKAVDCVEDKGCVFSIFNNKVRVTIIKNGHKIRCNGDNRPDAILLALINTIKYFNNERYKGD